MLTRINTIIGIIIHEAILLLETLQCDLINCDNRIKPRFYTTIFIGLCNAIRIGLDLHMRDFFFLT